MEWYYSQNGNRKGPVPEAELRSMISNGSIATSELAWREGMDEWTPIYKISELAKEEESPSRSVMLKEGVAEITPLATPDATPLSTTETTPYGRPSPYQTPASAQPVSVQASGDVPNYLWQSIVVTLLCCVPFGIPAIVYASKVDGLKRAGDYSAAKAASDSARTWCWVAFGVGLVVSLLVVAAEIADSSNY